MDTKKLRQKILDLAIHGKLVPQDSNDEPASVLLERIRAEKERLIKEGKIKKSKASKTSDTPHYENRQVGEANVPFDVPKGWCWSTIGEVAESNIGLTYKPSDICENGVPVYRSNNIQNRRICLNELVRVSATILPKQYLQEGDLLICARNGSRNLVGKCAIIENLNEPTSFGAFMAVCRSVLNPWIFHVLNSDYFNEYLDDSNSTAINQVTQKMLLAFKIPVPPLIEQERIILQLQHWFTLIDQIEQEKVELHAVINQTKSKILDLAIHGKLVPQDPSDEPASELLKRINPKAELTCDNGHYKNLPTGWAMCKLSDLCKIENGFAFSSNDYKTEGTPLVRISNIVNNSIDLTECVYIQNKTDDRFIVARGDLLIAMSGATTGKMGVYSYEGTSYLNQRVGNIKILDNSLLLTGYRDVYMQSKVDDILKLAYGGAQPNISASVIGNFDFLLPPVDEQKRIIEAINFAFEYLDIIMESL